MPVRSFRIQDLLDYDDDHHQQLDRHQTEEVAVAEDDGDRLSVASSSPTPSVARQQSDKKNKDPACYSAVDLETEVRFAAHSWAKDTKLIHQSEVPLPIYIRNDQKFPSSWPPKRRIRTVFTGVQIANLEKRFHSQHYLTAGERMELARNLNLTALQVKTWFQNRRMKWKKTCQ